MRTVRDNYFIITGHTYDEYLKKFRHGIGKGKLLSFSAEEVKYLKKNKHYWEVIGPDGKTLYCQVPKVRAKHIIIPSIIAVVIAGGVVGGLYLPKLLGGFNGVVSKEEWKQSFSYLTDIGYDASSSNKASELNYKATGEVYVGYNHETLYSGKDLVVVKNPFGEYETVKIYNHQSQQYEDYSFRRYKNLPLVKNPLGNISSTTSLIHDTFDIAFESFYNCQDSFGFDSSSKYYIYDSKEVVHEDLFSELSCIIEFNKDKKIGYLNLKYVLNRPESEAGSEGICVSFDLKFTYGGQQIATWSENVGTIYDSHYIETSDDDVQDNKAVVGGTKTFNKNESFLVNLDFNQLTALNRKKFNFELYDSSNNIVLNWTNFIEVYYNGEKIKRVAGSEESTSYYYNLETKDVRGINLNFAPADKSTITLKFGVRILLVEPAVGDFQIWIQ